jgi:hypothetical protein
VCALLAPAVTLQMSRTTAYCLEANAHRLPPGHTRII